MKTAFASLETLTQSRHQQACDAEAQPEAEKAESTQEQPKQKTGFTKKHALAFGLTALAVAVASQVVKGYVQEKSGMNEEPEVTEEDKADDAE